MNFASYGEQAINLANLTPHGAPDDDTIRDFITAAFPTWWPGRWPWG